jgi:uncharacterized protein YjbJ (UPF0337 family)
MIVSACHRAVFLEILARRLQKTVVANQPGWRNLYGILGLTRHSSLLENSMGSTADKIKGATNEAIGKAKRGMGEATGSDKLQGEGAMQEAKGKGQKAVGSAKQATKDTVNKAAGAANKNL